MLAQSISKNSFILGGFALFTAGVLALTFSATESRIEASEKRAAQKALLEIVTPDRLDNDILGDTWTIPAEIAKQLDLSEKSTHVAHIAKKDGQPVAVIIPSVAPDGYSGDIKLIIGINLDGSIAGVRTLTHKETPGLGDKVDINKSDWILSFNNTSLSNPKVSKWGVKKDGGHFDQFTGATITSRAVVRQVKETLELYAEQKANIFATEKEAEKNSQ